MKYNIGLFNDSFPPTIDGVANTVYNYADIFTREYAECTVVTPKYPNVVDNYPFEVVRYSSAGISKKLEYRVGNVVPVKTLKMLRNKNFDLIHVHSPFVSSIVADELAKLQPGTPVILTYHTKFDVELEKRIKVKSFLKIAKRFVLHNIKQADEIWVVSEGAVESLQNLGYKGEYVVMRNGTDFKIGASPDKNIRELRESIGIADDELVFLFVGRMMWYKNIKLILDAMRLLPGEMKFKMVFVGDGNDRKNIEQYARHIGISKKCIFPGAVYNRELLRDYYSMADLFVFPSTYDTSGLVVMEAAATALPAVLIKGSCAAEGIIDDRNGFLCEESEKSLKDKILEAVSDKEHLEYVSRNAQSEVYCSWEDSARKAYERYEYVIENYNKRVNSGKKRKGKL